MEKDVKKRKRLTPESTILLTIFFTALIMVVVGVIYGISNFTKEITSQQEKVKEISVQMNDIEKC